ncbi:MAG: hypothetical protein EON54_23450 [Alcaligenaceae bacterium]|nr:MAG: hypothetical protein EON54_23450 [Alcaligenaceae bacterium]
MRDTNWSRCSSAALPGLRVLIDNTSTSENLESAPDHLSKARVSAYPADRHDVITAAASALLETWPQAYADWRSTLRVVVPRRPPSGWRMEGFTRSCMQGAVWINPSNLLTAFESLVHEQSVVKLRYIEEIAPILQKEQPDSRFGVAWRNDAPPVTGIFEAAYAHIHCLLALERYLCNGMARELRGVASTRLGELNRYASESLSLLRLHGHFTDAGRGFLHWAEKSLQLVAQ